MSRCLLVFAEMLELHGGIWEERLFERFAVADHASELERGETTRGGPSYTGAGRAMNVEGWNASEAARCIGQMHDRAAPVRCLGGEVGKARGRLFCAADESGNGLFLANPLVIVRLHILQPYQLIIPKCNYNNQLN